MDSPPFKELKGLRYVPTDGRSSVYIMEFVTSDKFRVWTIRKHAIVPLPMVASMKSSILVPFGKREVGFELLMIVACPRHPWWHLTRWTTSIVMSEDSTGLVESGKPAKSEHGRWDEEGSRLITISPSAGAGSAIVD